MKQSLLRLFGVKNNGITDAERTSATNDHTNIAPPPFAHANAKIYTFLRLSLTRCALLVALLIGGVNGVWGETLFNLTDYTNKPEGWTASGDIGYGSYFKMPANASLTSPLYEPHNDLSFTCKVAQFGNGTNNELTIQVLDESGSIKATYLTTSGSTDKNYKSSTTSIGNIDYKFHIKLIGADAKIIRLQSPVLTGTAAAPKNEYWVSWQADNDYLDEAERKVTEGDKPILPSKPNDCSDGKKFVGWIDSELIDNLETNKASIFDSHAKAPFITKKTHFFAVYANVSTITGTQSFSSTPATSITSGSVYLITIKDYYLAASQDEGNNPSAVSFSDISTIPSTEGFTFTESSGSYTIVSNDGENKLLQSTDAAQGIYLGGSTTNPTTTWSCTYNEGSWKFRGAGTTRYLSLYTKPDFRYYTSGDQDVKLYCLEGGSSVTCSDYTTTCSAPTPEPPAITPAGGTFDKPIEVTIIPKANSTGVKYSTNGNDPNIEYSTAFTLPDASHYESSGKHRVRAYSFDASANTTSAETVVDYIFKSANPTFSLPTGTTIAAGTQITLSCTTPNATIFYTTDGSSPLDLESTQEYNGPITINSTTTIRAIASTNYFQDSEEVTATYTVTTYSLQKAVVGSGSISLDPNTAQVAGTKITATATAEDGYRFTGWTYSGTATNITSLSTNPTEVTLEASNDITLTANFELINTSCAGQYSFHWGERGNDPTWEKLCFDVNGEGDEKQILNFEIPGDDKPHFYVGWEGNWQSGHSADANFGDDMKLAQYRGASFKAIPAEGAVGTLCIYGNSIDPNWYIGFNPNSYSITYGIEGQASTWVNVPFAYAGHDDDVWETAEVTISKHYNPESTKYYTGITKSDPEALSAYCTNKSNTTEMHPLSEQLAAGVHGKFRMHDTGGSEDGNDNFQTTFIPYYNILYHDENGNFTESSKYISSEKNDDERTINLLTPEARDGFTFRGWSHNPDGSGELTAGGGEYILRHPNDPLYPVWEEGEWKLLEKETYLQAGDEVIIADNGDNKAAMGTFSNNRFTDAGITYSTDLKSVTYLSTEAKIFTIGGKHDAWKFNNGTSFLSEPSEEGKIGFSSTQTEWKIQLTDKKASIYTYSSKMNSQGDRALYRLQHEIGVTVNKWAAWGNSTNKTPSIYYKANETPRIIVSSYSVEGLSCNQGALSTTAYTRFKVKGLNLGSNNITLEAQEGFVLCETENGEYKTSLEVTPEEKTIYIRMSGEGDITDNKIGTLSAKATGAQERKVTLKGVISKPEPILTVSETELSFEYLEGQGPSKSQEIKINGTNLEDSRMISTIIRWPFEGKALEEDEKSYRDIIELYDDDKDGIIESTILVRLKAGLSTGLYNEEGASTYCQVHTMGPEPIQVILKGEVIEAHNITWKNNNQPITDGDQTTAVAVGGTITTLPAPPSAPDACSDKEFVGWTDTPTDPAHLYKSVEDFSAVAINEDKTFYAVFATPDAPIWNKTTIEEITPSDVVVITYSKEGTYWAMSNDNGTSKAPTAVVVTVEEDQITSAVDDIIQWNITNNSGNLTIYPNGETESWLYCTNSNTGVRVGTGTDKTFIIESTYGYLYNIGQKRYVGVYDNKDFRCYTTTPDNNNNNIKNQTLAFFKKAETTYSDYATECCYPLEIIANTTSRTSKTFIAEWTDLTDVAVSYTFALKQGDAIVDGYPKEGLTTNLLEVKDLMPNTTYTWTVTAIGKQNYCDVESAEQTVKTLEYDCNARTASFAQDEVTKQVSDLNFTNPLTITENEGGTVQDGGKRHFESTNTDVATVNATTGEVTIVGVGTTTISVTVSKTDTDPIYCPVEASYILIVTKNKFKVDWKYNGTAYTDGSPTTTVYSGEQVTELPDAPTVPSGCAFDKIFVGWTAQDYSEHPNDDAPTDLFTTAEGSPVITADVTFHAVFARPAYKKITSASELTDGTYLIVCESKNVAMAAQNDDIREGTYVTIINSNAISDKAEAHEFTLTKTGNKYTIADGSNCLYYTGSNNNIYASTAIQTNSYWTIEIDASGNTAITNAEYTERLIRYNSNQPRFACYKGTQQPIALFKKSDTRGYITLCDNNDVTVHSGTTWNVDTDNEIRHLIVEPDGKVKVEENVTLNVESVTLRSEGDVMPHLILTGDLNSESQTLKFTKRIPADRYYFFSLPYTCKLTDIEFSDGKGEGAQNEKWLIKYYDGANRATGKEGDNWKALDKTDVLTAGAGYALVISNEYTTPMEVVFPMELEHDNLYILDNTEKSISIKAHGKKDDGNWPDDITHNHMGWNFVGNPYFTTYGKDGTQTTDGLKGGKIEYIDGKDQWTDEQNVYLTIPYPNQNQYYYQELASTALIDPFMPFFVQAAADCDLTFTPYEGKQNAPIRYAYSAEENKTKSVFAGISLTYGDLFDKTSLVINNRYTQEYEIGADLEKMIGRGVRPQVYVVDDTYKYAFKALNENDAASINMLGVYLPTQGTYTFDIIEDYDMSNVQGIFLTDFVTYKTTNLMRTPYTFTSDKATTEQRFAISVILAPETVTSLNDVKATWSVWQSAERTLSMIGLNEGEQVRVIDITGKLVNTFTAEDSTLVFEVPLNGTYCIIANGVVKKIIVH